jgi:hypothetical protein
LHRQEHSVPIDRFWPLNSPHGVRLAKAMTIFNILIHCLTVRRPDKNRATLISTEFA